ncbi:MAG: phosphoribosylformylglycinamidine synthase subunit PurS [Chloroflexi bacterium]|nr:phosphoribosylformylglycinamidine synthase subunit PurS [Chloroflexota bacterium]
MAEFAATIHVRPKAEVRDPQGEAITAALRSLGFDVAQVRTGKEFVVRFSAADETRAREAARTMGDQLLANPVIDDYAVELRAPARSVPR